MNLKNCLLKNFKDFKLNLPLLLQIMFTEAVLILAIVSLVAPQFLPFFYIIVGLTLLIMAYNNYFYFKKKYFNQFCIVLSIIYLCLACYFIIYSIWRLFI